ncbi:hypothetical protein [uncultured Microbacterium sp.]|uniref:hypothetical protein n=1 Tax=uncultured Microbacterium sp. TaxID=191216 RepID=UPI0025EFDF82|nr:hypothetical protein [uncultured Microbacterium sp.]
MADTPNTSGSAEDPRDRLEGTYTERAGEPDQERTVHGQYTRTEQGGPDTETRGTYAGAEHEDGSTPPPRSTHDRLGKYIRKDQ